MVGGGGQEVGGCGIEWSPTHTINVWGKKGEGEKGEGVGEKGGGVWGEGGIEDKGEGDGMKGGGVTGENPPFSP